jgi:hypothetical protein
MARDLFQTDGLPPLRLAPPTDAGVSQLLRRVFGDPVADSPMLHAAVLHALQVASPFSVGRDGGQGRARPVPMEALNRLTDFSAE